MLDKFQPDMLITFGITTLQSCNNKNIYLYSKCRENKLQERNKNNTSTHNAIIASKITATTTNKSNKAVDKAQKDRQVQCSNLWYKGMYQWHS